MSDCLTSLVGGDSHRHSLFRSRALRWDSVHCPHFEGVVGVGLQLIDGHPGSLQAQLLGAEVDAVTTGLTAPTVRAAALTDHVICQVLASSWAPGWAPLQVYRCLIHIGDEVDRRWWRTYRGGRMRKELMLLPVVVRGQMLSRYRVTLYYYNIYNIYCGYYWMME